MGSEHAIPEDLKAVYAVAVGQRNTWPREIVVKLIERIAALEAQVPKNCECAADDQCSMGKRIEELEAQVAALSKPVSASEYFDRCVIGDGNKAVSIFNRIIAARLKAEEPK